MMVPVEEWRVIFGKDSSSCTATAIGNTYRAIQSSRRSNSNWGGLHQNSELEIIIAGAEQGATQLVPIVVTTLRWCNPHKSEDLRRRKVRPIYEGTLS